MSGYTEEAPKARSRRNMWALIGLSSGVIGLLAGVVLGPVAVILSGVGLHKANQGEGGRGQAIAGLVVGFIDIAVFIAVLALRSNHSIGWHIG